MVMENLQYQDIRSYLVMLIFVYNSYSYCDFIIFNCMEYTLPFKSMGSERFEMFLKNNFFCSPNCIYLIQNTVKTNIVKYYYILK